VLASAR